MKTGINLNVKLSTTSGDTSPEVLKNEKNMTLEFGKKKKKENPHCKSYVILRNVIVNVIH